MRITNEQNSATIATINQKVSMCRDIIANSNIKHMFVILVILMLTLLSMQYMTGDMTGGFELGALPSLLL